MLETIYEIYIMEYNMYKWSHFSTSKKMEGSII